MEKNKFELGIEISENVYKTAMPKKIKRYDNIPKRVVKTKNLPNNMFYRYNPGVSSFIKKDIDV